MHLLPSIQNQWRKSISYYKLNTSFATQLCMCHCFCTQQCPHASTHAPASCERQKECEAAAEEGARSTWPTALPCSARAQSCRRQPPLLNVTPSAASVRLTQQIYVPPYIATRFVNGRCQGGETCYGCTCESSGLGEMGF